VGMATLREFHAAYPQIPVIILLASSKREIVLQAFRLGACGVLSRHEPLRSLSKCIRAVYKGQIFANGREMSPLPKCKRNVVQPPAEGPTHPTIRQPMRLSLKTLKNCLLWILDKLGASTRIELLFRKSQIPN
jgi:DNA-binding NarL/FixJ family response regulator